MIAFTFLAILGFVINPFSEVSSLFFKVTLGGAFGCIAHIAEDAVTGTVPGLTLYSRMGESIF